MNDDLMTRPSMTPDAARRLRINGIPTRAALAEQTPGQPGVIAYIADVSLERVKMWMGELERGERADPLESAK